MDNKKVLEFKSPVFLKIVAIFLISVFSSVIIVNLEIFLSTLVSLDFFSPVFVFLKYSLIIVTLFVILLLILRSRVILVADQEYLSYKLPFFNRFQKISPIFYIFKNTYRKIYWSDIDRIDYINPVKSILFWNKVYLRVYIKDEKKYPHNGSYIARSYYNFFTKGIFQSLIDKSCVLIRVTDLSGEEIIGQLKPYMNNGN